MAAGSALGLTSFDVSAGLRESHQVPLTIAAAAVFSCGDLTSSLLQELTDSLREIQAPREEAQISLFLPCLSV